MNRTIILIGLGGILGSFARFAISNSLKSNFQGVFPVSTLLVNWTGCFLVGIIYGLSERFAWAGSDWKSFLVIGFCGAYTTFSTFAHENIVLLENGSYWRFGTYSFASFAGCLAATYIGLLASRISI